MKSFLFVFVLVLSASSFAEVASDFAGGLLKNRKTNEYLAAKCTTKAADKCTGYTFIVLAKVDADNFEFLGELGTEKKFSDIKANLKPAQDLDLNQLTNYKFDRLPIYMTSTKKIGTVMYLTNKHYVSITDVLNN